MDDFDPEALRAQLIDLRRHMTAFAEIADNLEKLLGKPDKRQIAYITIEALPEKSVKGFFAPGLVVRGRKELAELLGVSPNAVSIARADALRKWEVSGDRHGEDKGKFAIRGVTLMTTADYYAAVLDYGLEQVHDPENPPPME